MVSRIISPFDCMSVSEEEAESAASKGSPVSLSMGVPQGVRAVFDFCSHETKHNRLTMKNKKRCINYE